jgi:hypothetical protein
VLEKMLSSSILCDMINPNYILRGVLSMMGCSIFKRFHQILADLDALGIVATRRKLGIG